MSNLTSWEWNTQHLDVVNGLKTYTTQSAQVCYSKRRSLQPKGAVWFHGSKSDTAPLGRVYSQWPADPRGWTRAPSEWPCSRTSAGPATAHDLGSSLPEPAFGPGCQTETGKHTKEVSTILCEHHHLIYFLSYTSIRKWFLVFLLGWHWSIINRAWKQSLCKSF